MTWYTHVNRNLVGKDTPVVRFQKGKRGKAIYCFEVELPAGSRVVYSPHEPILPCGARLVITSPTAPVVIR